MLLAEDLLLLLTDDDTGRLTANSTQVDVALGGALLVELALAGRVDVAGPEQRVREGWLLVTDPSPPGDALLDEALATVTEKESKKPQSVVTRLGKGLRGRLYERLVADGVLRAEEGKILGVFPSHRWPTEDGAHESTVRARVVTALQQGMPTDPSTGALVSLLLALRVLPKAVPPDAVGLSRRELNASAKRIAEADWAAKAVRKAIDGTNAAIVAATSSAVISGGSG